MSKKILIKHIKDQAVKKGDFLLSSGKKSHYYLDLKLAYTQPEVLMEIASGVKEKIGGTGVERIAGLELGAVPIAVAVSIETQIPFVIIRKERKGYGAGNRVEGEVKEGDNVVLVEDVVTTGESLVSAVEAIREAGGVCNMAIAVVDRMEGAEERLKKINIALNPLITIEELEL
jgi:orotate phosphoribosyltransferase